MFFGGTPNRVEDENYYVRELSKEIIQTKWLKEDKTYSHDFNCLFLCSSLCLKHRMIFFSLSHSDLLCLASVSMPYFTKLSSCVKYSTLSYLKTGSVPFFHFFQVENKIKILLCFTRKHLYFWKHVCYHLLSYRNGTIWRCRGVIFVIVMDWLKTNT